MHVFVCLQVCCFLPCHSVSCIKRRCHLHTERNLLNDWWYYPDFSHQLGKLLIRAHAVLAQVKIYHRLYQDLTPCSVFAPLQVVFTRRSALHRSDDAGRTFKEVHTFKLPTGGRKKPGEKPVNWNRFASARLHNIAVAAGRQADTMSVAVIVPKPGDSITTDTVDVAIAQGADDGAIYTSSSLSTIANWTDTRLTGGTTTSPAWQGNNRLFVSSVALPSPELIAAGRTPRPRIAFAEVTDAGIGAFTKCVATGLPDTPVQRILVDSTTIYAATWLGVYISTDNCATFREFGAGLPNVQVRDLYLLQPSDTQPAVLRAGTYGRGVWELNLP